MLCLHLFVLNISYFLQRITVFCYIWCIHTMFYKVHNISRYSLFIHTVFSTYFCSYIVIFFSNCVTMLHSFKFTLAAFPSPTVLYIVPSASRSLPSLPCFFPPPTTPFASLITTLPLPLEADCLCNAHWQEWLYLNHINALNTPPLPLLCPLRVANVWHLVNTGFQKVAVYTIYSL